MAEELQWSDELIEKFWNYHSQFPEQYFTANFGKTILNSVSRHVPNVGKFLDLGCGGGHFIQHLLNKKGESAIYGADVSRDSIDSVNQRFKATEQFKGCYHTDELIAKQERFDAIFLLEVVEHVNDSQLAQLFNQVKSLIAPKGAVIITTPNDEDLAENTVYCPVSNTTFHRWQHVRSWSESALNNFMTSQSFKVVNTTTTNFCIQRKMSSPDYWFYLFKRLIRPRKQPHLLCLCENVSDST